MMNEMSDTELAAIPIVEGGFDANAYKGFKTKIEKVWVDKNAINWYTGSLDSKGRPTYNPNSTEIMQKVVIETCPLPILDNNGNPTKDILSFKTGDSGEKIPYRVTARFNLTFKEGQWVVSKAQRAKLWPFMRKLGASTIDQLQNKIVVLDTTPDKDEHSEKLWLRISQ